MLWISNNTVIIDCEIELSHHYARIAPREGQFDTPHPYQVAKETDNVTSERGDTPEFNCALLQEACHDNKPRSVQAEGRTGRCGPVEADSQQKSTRAGSTSATDDKYGNSVSGRLSLVTLQKVQGGGEEVGRRGGLWRKSNGSRGSHPLSSIVALLLEPFQIDSSGVGESRHGLLRNAQFDGVKV